MVRYQGRYYFRGGISTRGGSSARRRWGASLTSGKPTTAICTAPGPSGVTTTGSGCPSTRTTPTRRCWPGRAPHRGRWLGTDTLGRDLFARLAYGYRFSLTFALVVTLLTYALGIASGALLGYFGGRLDLYGLRLVEIWAAIPFLYTILILSASLRPGFYLLALLLAAFEWVGSPCPMHGEVLREKGRDYVAAAVAIGERDLPILFRHILPQLPDLGHHLRPVQRRRQHHGGIVQLDYLGFGVPPPTPSWGELLKQGRQHPRLAPDPVPAAGADPDLAARRVRR